MIPTVPFLKTFYYEIYIQKNIHPGNYHLRTLLIIFEGSYVLPSETTAKLNFMLLILWLFFTFIPFISQCDVSEIHPFVQMCNLVHLLSRRCRNPLQEYTRIQLPILLVYVLIVAFFAIMNNATTNRPVYVSLYVRVSLESII